MYSKINSMSGDNLCIIQINELSVPFVCKLKKSCRKSSVHQRLENRCNVDGEYLPNLYLIAFIIVSRHTIPLHRSKAVNMWAVSQKNRSHDLCHVIHKEDLTGTTPPFLYINLWTIKLPPIMYGIYPPAYNIEMGYSWRALWYGQCPRSFTHH